MLEQGTVYYGQTPITFVVRRSARRRSVGITIEPQGVRVNAPKRMPLERVVDLVSTKARWIVTKQAEMLRIVQPPKRFEQGEEHWYLGQKLKLQMGETRIQPELFSYNFCKKVPAVELGGDVLRVEMGSSEQVRSALESWYRSEAQRIIPQRVQDYANQLGWPMPTVLVRNQKKRWGSCNSKGELRFNWRLVMIPMELLDYVVVHEMAHLKVLDHSRRYWRLVEQIMSDYKVRHQALEQVSGVLLW